MLQVCSVDPSGAAARLGISAGDHVLAINGRELRDVIDYKYHISDDRVVLRIRTGTGAERNVTIRKEPDDDLGVEFAPFAIKRCRNRCIFCFVDQMPRGCRRSLSVKDDDYRASFLYGNYITLGNLDEPEWERIFAQRLSPLYVSVHATEPEIRRFLLGRSSAPDILSSMRRLAGGGIRMHAQVVLCPGINDGPHLVRTVQDLARMHPLVLSVAVVPVGLTGHRKGLYPLKPVTRAAARTVLKTLETMGKRYRKSLGTRFVYPSDEFYIKAGQGVPSLPFYEDLPQIENGVGMVAQFLHDAGRTKQRRDAGRVKATVVTGASFGRLLRSALQGHRATAGAVVRTVIAANRFFGPSVTVAGLLTGSDILHALRGRKPGDMVLVPSNALREGDDVFLDGMTLAHLERELGVPVKKAGSLGELAALLNS